VFFFFCTVRALGRTGQNKKKYNPFMDLNTDIPSSQQPQQQQQISGPTRYNPQQSAAAAVVQAFSIRSVG
jgi:hypothetical protein